MPSLQFRCTQLSHSQDYVPGFAMNSPFLPMNPSFGQIFDNQRQKIFIAAVDTGLKRFLFNYLS